MVLIEFNALQDVLLAKPVGNIVGCSVGTIPSYERDLLFGCSVQIVILLVVLKFRQLAVFVNCIET